MYTVQSKSTVRPLERLSSGDSPKIPYPHTHLKVRHNPLGFLFIGDSDQDPEYGTPGMAVGAGS